MLGLGGAGWRGKRLAAILPGRCAPCRRLSIVSTAGRRAIRQAAVSNGLSSNRKRVATDWAPCNRPDGLLLLPSAGQFHRIYQASKRTNRIRGALARNLRLLHEPLRAQHQVALFAVLYYFQVLIPDPLVSNRLLPFGMPLASPSERSRSQWEGSFVLTLS